MSLRKVLFPIIISLSITTIGCSNKTTKIEEKPSLPRVTIPTVQSIKIENSKITPNQILAYPGDDILIEIKAVDGNHTLRSKSESIDFETTNIRRGHQHIFTILLPSDIEPGSYTFSSNETNSLKLKVLEE